MIQTVSMRQPGKIILTHGAAWRRGLADLRHSSEMMMRYAHHHFEHWNRGALSDYRESGYGIIAEGL